MDEVIRRARPSDAAEMEACVASAYRHYIQRIGMAPGPMLDDYSEVIRCHQAFVAESEGHLVGVLVLVIKNAEILLDNIAVHPEYQGMGLGRRLMAFAEDEARAREHWYLSLYTHELMTENITLYRRLGYAETARRRERGFRRVYMRKDLRHADR